MQYEAPSAQCPSAPQRLEQHCALDVQAFPAVLQLLFSA
jgi:hypothetical protein